MEGLGLFLKDLFKELGLSQLEDNLVPIKGVEVLVEEPTTHCIIKVHQTDGHVSEYDLADLIVTQWVRS